MPLYGPALQRLLIYLSSMVKQVLTTSINHYGHFIPDGICCHTVGLSTYKGASTALFISESLARDLPLIGTVKGGKH